MLNKLRQFSRQQGLIHPGDSIICAVSGGADSMALLWAMYLLKEQWQLQLSAAHFNHHLRGTESDRDEQFVRQFCRDYHIPLYVGSADVQPGKKGLEAAAREARYAFFATLPGKIATAHTADDNAETVLMHLVRGTGLKGLGGIMPQNQAVIRPMLNITRQDVAQFLEEYSIPHIDDSSNAEDLFLRNRIRHHVLPLLQAENPKFSEHLSAMALRLRLDEQALTALAVSDRPLQISQLRTMPPALRSRSLEHFLKCSGVREPEAAHIAQLEALVFSQCPSACAQFPGGITIGRNYDTLQVRSTAPNEASYQLDICPAAEIVNTPTVFTVHTQGTISLRYRRSGDCIRLSGGTKTLKKLFIDRKIPAAERDRIPIICDEKGILGVYGIGVNLDRAAAELPATRISLNLSSSASAVN